jgi:ATP-binding cassette subfamily F protein 3
VADGTVRPFDGDLDDYRMLLAERSRSVSKASTATRKDDRRERAEARAALAPLRRKAQDAEKRIAALAAEQAKIETKLADPALYVSGRTAEITAANARLAAIAKEAQAAEEEWLMAAEELELAGY